jgi:flavodoxin
MTRALVIYESIFGDARTIAHAIADGLSASIPTDVLAASEAPTEIDPDVGLLVVGGPNHAFGMPRPSTREGAVKQYGADIADTGTGLHEWLEAVRVPSSGTPAAAFDTRGSGHPLLTKMDHAARTEEKLLGKLGAKVVTPAEHYFVADAKGPLVDGEEDRARRWGRTLANLVAGGSAST